MVVGTAIWKDGDAVRVGLHWMLDRYGRDWTQLIVVGGDPDGFPAIARRAWHELDGVDPNVRSFLYYGNDGTLAIGAAAIGLRQREQRARLLREARPQAVLVFRGDRQTKSQAVLLGRAAKDVGIPAWRWSRSLRRPVEVGADAHYGRRYDESWDPAYDE